MTPRRKQGRPDNILAWLFADPWRKLGAIVLALISWEYLDKKVNDELESKLEIRLPAEAGTGSTTNNYLRIDLQADEYTLTGEDVLKATEDQPLEDPEIEIKIEGEKATIDRLKSDLRLKYSPNRLQLRSARESGFLTFGVEDLEHEKADLEADLKRLDKVEMTPERIRLRIRPNATKKLPLAEGLVELDYGRSGLEDRLANPDFSQRTVELRGPLEAIKNLPSSAPIFQGRVPRPIDESATKVTIQLELRPEYKELRVSDTVFVIYTVEPDWQPVVFRNVPIDIDNRLLKPDQQRLDPFRLDRTELPVVRLEVKGELWRMLNTVKANAQGMADFQRRHLRLVVYPRPDDLKKTHWPLKPWVEFVLFEDIPTPQKGIDFKEVDVDSVNIVKKQ